MTKAGDTYSRLTVIVAAQPTRQGRPRWAVRCSCGKEKIVAQADLRSGHIKSCGCLRRETTRSNRTTHGCTDSGEYRVWCHMIGRCYNETDHKYPDYGGRGITICERWRGSFENFLADMGERPSPKHTIDRVDNAGNYEPGNCRWATAVEQGQNKRNNVSVILRGEIVVVAEAERRLGVCGGAVHQRVKHGNSASYQQAVDWFYRKYGLGGAQPEGQ